MHFRTANRARHNLHGAGGIIVTHVKVYQFKNRRP